MEEKRDVELKENIELDEMEVIDATYEGVDDDDDDAVLYDADTDEKHSEPYVAAVRAMTFGCISLIVPLFAWIVSVFGGGYLVPVLVAAAGVICAVVGLISAKKCVFAPSGTLSEGLVKTGKLVSIIGLCVSVLVLAYILVSLILTIIVVVAMIVFYVIMYAFAFLLAILGAL